MLYLNQMRGGSSDYALNFNGTNQYLQSRTTAQGGLDFVQWERTQPWTFSFFSFTRQTQLINSCIFDNRLNSGRGILVEYANNTTIRIRIFSAANNYLGVDFIVNTESKNYTIIYDGSSSFNGINMYQDSILCTKSLISESLTSSITGSNSFSIGFRNTTGQNLYNGIISHISFVNYIKSTLELTEDFNNKKQSVGTGSWLLAPIEPIYNNNGSKQIKTLSTTSINNPLPNPNAFLNQQGYKLNLVNYPTTLVKGVNLIKL